MQTPTRPVASGVALGRVAGALLVAHEDVADLLGVEQRVVGREDRAAGDAEDGVDPGVLERADEALGAGQLLGHRSSSVSRAVLAGCGWRAGLADGAGNEKAPRTIRSARVRVA